MQIATLKEMYLISLEELTDLEDQLIEALGRMAEAAAHDGLRDALAHHRDVTRMQRARVADLLRDHGVAPGQHRDQAMQSLLLEAEKMQGMLASDALRDAGIIDSAQRIEHYEIAAYGTAAAYAGVLDLRDDQSALHLTLEEEKAADAELTLIAKTIVNASALRAA